MFEEASEVSIFPHEVTVSFIVKFFIQDKQT